MCVQGKQNTLCPILSILSHILNWCVSVLLLFLFQITNKSIHKQRLKYADDKLCVTVEDIKIIANILSLQLEYRNIIFQHKTNMDNITFLRMCTLIRRGV